MVSHTPGPWDAVKNVPASGHDYSVWTVYPPSPPDEKVAGCVAEVYMGEADTRLIAAAPDLLAALEAWMEAVPRRQSWCVEEHAQARAAIAKARGEG